MIHPSAIVDKHAELDSTVEVGPYAVIGPKVRIGPRTRVGAHAVIEGDTTIGEGNAIFQFAAIGAIPQDLKYAGEPTRLVIGNSNRIREFATVHIGTAAGGNAPELSPLSPVAVPLRVRTPECVLISARRRCPARALLPWTAITTWMCALPLTISPVPVISAGMA